MAAYLELDHRSFSLSETLVASWAATAVSAGINWTLDTSTDEAFLGQVLGRAVRLRPLVVLLWVGSSLSGSRVGASAAVACFPGCYAGGVRVPSRIDQGGPARPERVGRVRPGGPRNSGGLDELSDYDEVAHPAVPIR